MRNVLFAMAAVVCLASQSATAAEVAFGFKVHHGPIPLEGLSGIERDAADAIETRYGAEDGFLAVVGGKRGGLTILVSRWKNARRIWSKMLRNGDAFQRGSQGYYRVKSVEPPVPQVQWLRFGTAYMDEGAAATFPAPLRPEYVTLFKVTAHKSCSVSRAGVYTANHGERVRPTRLLDTQRSGNNIHYTYEVNGGDGALLRGIGVTLAPPRFGLFFNNCQVTVYIADE